MLILATSGIKGQTLKKYRIGASGCAAYFLCDPGTFQLDKSPDSSDVYTGECNAGNTSFGVICVKIKDKIDKLDVSEETLVAYLDYLKGNLNITKAAGYGKGHHLKNKENVRGIIDYWKDKDDVNWKVKGWTDGKFIVVMYVYAKEEIAEAKANAFLDGLLLPGM
jgi:hypothetical protein